MSSYVVAVTGGIASGKSEVTRRFEAIGVPVADADIAARQAVAVGSRGLAQVTGVFGVGVLDTAGELDRRAMRARVFDDADARNRLEAIIHPIVRELLRAQCAAATGPYVVVAIALLSEGGGRSAYPWLDRVLLVDVPVAVQRARLMQRDGIDAALAERMIAAQSTRAQRLALCEDVIVNDGSLDALERHAAALDRRYRALAADR